MATSGGDSTSAADGRRSGAFDAFVLVDTLRHEHGHCWPLGPPAQRLAEARAISATVNEWCSTSEPPGTGCARCRMPTI